MDTHANSFAQNRIETRKVIIAALMAALTCVGTMIIKIHEVMIILANR